MHVSYAEHARALQRHLDILPLRDRLDRLTPGLLDPSLSEAVLEQAARFAEGEIEPLGSVLDREGARLENGRVLTAAGHKQAWQAFAEMGWLAMSVAEPVGQALPLPLVTACEELFNRASAAFYMLATPARSGATLLLETAPEPLRDKWVPRLLSGEWAATICISEPDAGSDVGRIRTRARREDGRWFVSGEKCWISFGDHDLAPRIGHLMLARSLDKPGARGLSLFLVPSTLEDGAPNGIAVRRVEEKLGLHGSPTCALGFEDSEGFLLGEEGRGLQHLFRMMLLMRLACGPQGSGVASAALSAAWGYAQDRRQGGVPERRAVPIAAHADVQRQLLAMAAKVELTRGLNLIAAMVMELAGQATDASERAEWMMLAQFLLPLVKDGSAWAAFEVSNDAVQVLGGAGYTCEWPVERYLRDARVFPIFEGTTGIQALDLVHRRLWRDRGAGLAAFVALTRQDSEGLPQLAVALDRLEQTARTFIEWEATPRRAEAGATALLDLCKLAAQGWVAARIVRLGGDSETGRQMAMAARFFLAELDLRSDYLARLAMLGEARLAPLEMACGE